MYDRGNEKWREEFNTMTSTRYTFWVLILIVSIAGVSQGLSIPLLAVMLEIRACRLGPTA